MYKIGLFISPLIVVLFCFSGCGGISHKQVIPDKVAVDDSDLPDLRTTTPVRVVARHSGNLMTDVICNLNNRLYFDANQDILTDRAAESLLDILRRRGIIVSDAAKKNLEISILGGDCEPEFWSGMVQFRIRLGVAYGNGNVREFRGDDRMGSGKANEPVARAINGALLEMLKDAELKAFLENNK